MKIDPTVKVSEFRMFGGASERTLQKCEQPDSQGFQFNKLFPCLPSFAEGEDETDVINRLKRLGKKGGKMDAKDPRITLVNPLDSNTNCISGDPDHPCNPDNTNPEMTVGFTFLGQFLDHDITLDKQRLELCVPEEPNLRTPFFDLDSMYGQGPIQSPKLYDTDPLRPARLKLEVVFPRDLPRENSEKACIADGRNDENVIISQLHLAFIKFHNQVVQFVERQQTGLSPQTLFDEAQRLVQWHYQYIIVNQFLKVTLDPDIYNDVKTNGPSRFTVEEKPKIPREFQVAAFRFGHSQIRPGYKINVMFGAPIFDSDLDSLDRPPNEPQVPLDLDPNDLRGGRRAPRRFVEWDTFFDFGTKEIVIDPISGAIVIKNKVKKNKRIDPFISSPMFDLPFGPGLPGSGADGAVRTLAGRNLERHYQHGIASGQRIATALGYTPLSASDTAALSDVGFQERTPLFWYILKEALVQKQGERLGQVGSKILAEVFFGLLLSDPKSYWAMDKNWIPTLPRRNGSTSGDFTMVDLLTFARAV